MFTKNEQKILSLLKASAEALVFSELVRKCKLPRSSTHKALKSLLERGVVEPQKDKTYRIAPRDHIEKALENYTSAFRSAVYGASKEEEKRLVVFSDQYVLPERYLEQLRTKYRVRTYDTSPQYITDELFELRTRDAEIIVRFDAPKVDQTFLENRPSLQAIVCPAYFHINIDPELCAEYGVTVKKFDSHSQKYYATTELEYVLNVLLNLLKPISRAAHATAKARTFYFKNHLGDDLAGKRVGIVFGDSDIGNFVRVFQFLGCSVSATNTLTAPPPALQFGLTTYHTLEKLWDSSDVVIFIDDMGEGLSLDTLLSRPTMPEYLIVRTEDVRYDSELMRKRILEGKLKGFAADFIPDMFVNKGYLEDLQQSLHPIVNLPNVLFTPEMGTFSNDSLQRSYDYTFRLLMELP